MKAEFKFHKGDKIRNKESGDVMYVRRVETMPGAGEGYNLLHIDEGNESAGIFLPLDKQYDYEIALSDLDLDLYRAVTEACTTDNFSFCLDLREIQILSTKILTTMAKHGIKCEDSERYLNKALCRKNWWFGRPFSIHMFARYFDLDKPIVGGNWNPREFISEENWRWVLDCISRYPIPDTRSFYTIIGKSREDSQYNVSIEELLSEISCILRRGGSNLESEGFDRYYDSGMECFVVVQDDNTNKGRKTWVVIASSRIFEELGLTPDACNDYLVVQKRGSDLCGSSIIKKL